MVAINCRFKLWRKTRILDQSTQESTSTQQLSLLTVVRPYLDCKMIKPITEVVTITCLWHNDLFAKKSPKAKFAIAALLCFWITSWKYFICPRKLGNQNIAKTVRASLTDVHKLLFSYMISLIWKGQCMYLKGFSITKILRDYILLMWFLRTPGSDKGSQ